MGVLRIIILLLLALNCQAQRAPSYRQGLVAYYQMNEGGGGKAFDMLNRYNLNLSPNEWTNLDKTMYIHTNGNGCSLPVPDNTALDIRTNKISFGGWIYPIASNIYQVICGRIYDQTFRQYAIYLGASGVNSIFLTLNGVWTNQLVTTTKAYNVNQWNHIILTYNGATITVYVNGISGYSIAKTGNIAVTAYSNVPFQIGAEASPSSGYYRCTGRMGPQGVWNRPLTQSEVQALFLKGPYTNPFK